MTDREPPPPTTPPCLECGQTERVEPVSLTIAGKHYRWFAACHNLPMEGTASEAARHTAARIAAAAERGDLDHRPWKAKP